MSISGCVPSLKPLAFEAYYTRSLKDYFRQVKQGYSHKLTALEADAE